MKAWPLRELLVQLAVAAEATDHPIDQVGEVGEEVVDTQLAHLEVRTYNDKSRQLASTLMHLTSTLRDPVTALYQDHHERTGVYPSQADADLVREALLVGFPVPTANVWTLAAWSDPSKSWPRMPSGEVAIIVSQTPWAALVTLGMVLRRQAELREQQIAASCRPQPLTPAEIAARAEERLREVEASNPTE